MPIKKYTCSKIAIYLIFFLLFAEIALFLVMLFAPISDTKSPPYLFFICAMMFLGFVEMTIFALLEIKAHYIIITYNKIHIKYLSQKISIPIHEIKSFHFQLEDLILVHRSNPKKNLIIKSFYYLSNRLEFMTWLNATFVNEHRAKRIRELTTILQNESYGKTPKERHAKLVQTKKITEWMNTIAGICMFWLLFNSFSDDVISSLILIYPFCIILITNFYKGLIQIKDDDKTVYPNVIESVLILPSVIVARMLWDYHIFDSWNLWLWAIDITFVILIITMAIRKRWTPKSKKEFIGILAQTGIYLVYAMALVLVINCIYDKTTPVMFEAEVIQKNPKANKKLVNSSIRIAPWGSQKETEDIKVPLELFENVEVNEFVTVSLKEGKLGVSWYYITE